ncbi:uncharacterized protein ACR2FA_010246 [Aphomia sociella]
MRVLSAALLALSVSFAMSAEIGRPQAVREEAEASSPIDPTLARVRRQWHVGRGAGRRQSAPPAQAAPAPFSLLSDASRTSRSADVDRWIKLIQEYMRTGQTAGMSAMSGHFPQTPVTVDLPVGGGNGKAPEVLPVLVLPIPVPVQQQCQTNYDNRPSYEGQAGYQPFIVNNQVVPPPVPYEIVFPNRNAEFVPGDRQPAQNVVSSQQLVEEFRAQKPRSPELPPLVLPHSPRNFVTRAVRNIYSQNVSEGEPQKLSFDRSMLLKGHLTVHRADYTEPFLALYDAEHGMNRVDMHGGTSTSYRTLVPDGSTLRVLRTLDRTGDKELYKCLMMRSTSEQSDRAPPLLPDPQPFNFNGYVDMEDGTKAEQWMYTVSGEPGEMGAAPEEALTFNHELIVTRDEHGYNIPVSYGVNVDSSILGPKSDSYEHQYTQVSQTTPELDKLRIDLDRECGEVEETDKVEKVEPLSEYTMPHRHQRHKRGILDYTSKFARKFVDGTEEAVRKNLLMQTTRFTESANRQAGTAKMALNFLADRLLTEVGYLVGVEKGVDLRPGEKFPYLRTELRDIADKLLDRFDWRSQNAVTHVRYQNACKACWAFAVTAAIEGALKIRSGKLVALSEKSLVDCGHKNGAKGCGGTWPSRAYDYVRDRGIPALGEYRKYEPKVEQCEDENVTPVTFISGHVNVTRNNLAALKVAIAKHGPTVVTVDGLCYSFIRYESGVLQDERCSITAENHAVTAVGYGGNLLKGMYFTLKNSWGTSFGEKGFIRVHGPSNTAGVLTRPSYPILESDDVKRIPPEEVNDPYQDEVGGGIKTR